MNSEERIKNKELREVNNLNSKFIILNSIHKFPWPSYDPAMLVTDEVTVVVQINGKTRSTTKIPNIKSKIQKDVEELVKRDEKVKKYLEGKTILKTIFVPGRLINFVI